MHMKIYVPVDAFLLGHLRRGSAIVGREIADDQIWLRYEGNLYGASNLVNFEDRLSVAAGRLVDRYPTVAQMVVMADHVVEVGSFEYRREGSLVITNRARLAEWLGGEDDPVFARTGGAR